MGVVKVIVNGDTKMDITPTTADANEVNQGEVFFNRSGEQSVGVGDPPKTRVPVYGMGKNLLRNWYFGNPVNQRGESSYTGVGYGVDGWSGRNVSTQVTVSSDSISLNATASGASGILDQAIENPEFLLNKRVTISAIVGGILETHTVDMPSSYSPGYIITGSRIYLGVESNGSVIFRFVQAYTWQLQIIAAKLELGSEQTLCHNEGTEANPVLVLNEVPDYEEELLKCQTSTADPSDTFANKIIATNVSNKNFLRNWYFVGGGTGRGVFPVNSRGVTSGQTWNYYGIDGWIWDYGGTAGVGTYSIMPNGVKLTPASSASGVTARIIQIPDDYASLDGKKITASVLLSDGTLKYGTITRTNNTNQTIQDDAVFGIDIRSDGTMRFMAKSELILQAVKLELGTEQTLAHKENGVWVLNDIPDYEYELYRCMTSTADSSDTFANKSLATQEQLASIEWGITASVRHEVGSYFCLNGLLYRTTVAIAVNGTITPGTNCEPANVADAIDPISKVLFAQATDIHTDTTVTLNDSCYKYKFLVLALSGDSGNSSSNRGSLTIPIATISGGMHYPVYVGTLGGVIRLGLLSGESDKLRVISTSISSIYLQSVYGIR